MHTCSPRVGVPDDVNSFYVRSFGQVIAMLSATIVHAAATSVQATRKPQPRTDRLGARFEA